MSDTASSDEDAIFAVDNDAVVAPPQQPVGTYNSPSKDDSDTEDDGGDDEEDDDGAGGDDNVEDVDDNNDEDDGNDNDDESTSELDSWRQVHAQLVQAVSIAREAVAAKELQRRFWLESSN